MIHLIVTDSFLLNNLLMFRFSPLNKSYINFRLINLDLLQIASIHLWPVCAWPKNSNSKIWLTCFAHVWWVQAMLAHVTIRREIAHSVKGAPKLFVISRNYRQDRQIAKTTASQTVQIWDSLDGTIKRNHSSKLKQL